MSGHFVTAHVSMAPCCTAGRASLRLPVAVYPLGVGPGRSPCRGLRTASLALSAKPSCPRSVCAGPRRCEDIKWRPFVSGARRGAPRAAPRSPEVPRASVLRPPEPRPGVTRSAAGSGDCGFLSSHRHAACRLLFLYEKWDLRV